MNMNKTILALIVAVACLMGLAAAANPPVTGTSTVTADVNPKITLEVPATINFGLVTPGETKTASGDAVDVTVKSNKEWVVDVINTASGLEKYMQIFVKDGDFTDLTGTKIVIYEGGQKPVVTPLCVDIFGNH